MGQSFWPCPTCHSLNSGKSKACYSCRARRPSADAPAPTTDVGPGLIGRAAPAPATSEAEAAAAAAGSATGLGSRPGFPAGAGHGTSGEPGPVMGPLGSRENGARVAAASTDAGSAEDSASGSRRRLRPGLPHRAPRAPRTPREPGAPSAPMAPTSPRSDPSPRESRADAPSPLDPAPRAARSSRGRFRGPVAVSAAILVLAAAVLGGLVATGGIQLTAHPATVLAASQSSASADPSSPAAQTPTDAAPAVARPSASQAKPRSHPASTGSPNATAH